MRYLIAGAFSRTMPIIKHLTKYKGKADLVVYDGINKCRWNGGRINREAFYTDGLVDYYYKKNISIALTFTNHQIDLTDKVGNELLHKFHRDGNAIILINEELRKHIRKNYPKYELIYSITGMGHLNIPLADEDIKFYKGLEGTYDWIVPRFEHVFDKRRDELNITKWEVMVNDTCVWKCNRFEEHFKAIADENTKGNPYTKEIEECWIKGFNPDNESKYDSMDIVADKMQELIDDGVTSFKIIGRELTDEEYYGELTRYMK
jgi:hypothetical protein